jgi:hypothetical protein
MGGMGRFKFKFKFMFKYTLARGWGDGAMVLVG